MHTFCMLPPPLDCACGSLHIHLVWSTTSIVHCHQTFDAVSWPITELTFHSKAQWCCWRRLQVLFAHQVFDALMHSLSTINGKSWILLLCLQKDWEWRHCYWCILHLSMYLGHAQQVVWRIWSWCYYQCSWNLSRTHRLSYPVLTYWPAVQHAHLPPQSQDCLLSWHSTHGGLQRGLGCWHEEYTQGLSPGVRK